MCGIFGFVGRRQASTVLLEGLEKLSYRGYDSAGIAVYEKNGVVAVRKKQGTVENLKRWIQKDSLHGTCGIGHTRWATHGAPSDINAHPQTDSEGKIVVVHNGMIENYNELRMDLQENGVVFTSDTDTEVIAHLIKKHYEGNMLQALIKVMQILQGTYALGILCAEEPERIFFVRCGSPLIAAYHDGEGMIASDIPAMLNFTRDVAYLEDGQMGVLSRQGIELYDEHGHSIAIKTFHVDWEAISAEKGDFAHFMLKEIYEQPSALRNVTENRDILEHARWFPLPTEEITKLEKVTIIGCGTAYHAGVLGSYAIEQLSRIPTSAEIASEYRYRSPVVGQNELVIAVSQSGETADTLAAVREAIKNGAKVMALCNVAGSALVREVGEEHTLYTCAGPEMAVASTKAYVTQTTLLLMTAIVLGRARRMLPDHHLDCLHKSLQKLPDDAYETLKCADCIRMLCKELKKQDYVLFVGRCGDYALSMEAALKLKEVSYLFSQAYPAGELKHGPIALLKPGQLLVAVVTQWNVFDKMIANLQEIKARGAYVLAVCTKVLAEKVKHHADKMIVIPETEEYFAPVLASIPMQLFAYFMAVERGTNVDRPRNLAKSVTVE